MREYPDNHWKHRDWFEPTPTEESKCENPGYDAVGKEMSCPNCHKSEVSQDKTPGIVVGYDFRKKETVQPSVQDGVQDDFVQKTVEEFREKYRTMRLYFTGLGESETTEKGIYHEFELPEVFETFLKEKLEEALNNGTT